MPVPFPASVLPSAVVPIRLFLTLLLLPVTSSMAEV